MAVVGIGGVFFRADDPGALQAWYQKHLGVGGDDPFNWVTEAGQTVFMPFARNTDHFPADRQWMINLRAVPNFPEGWKGDETHASLKRR
jgi:hypothetical protein